MGYSLTFSEAFKKHFGAFTEKQKKQIRNKLKILTENPAHPSLRVKRIKGTTSLWEMSVNMDIRIFFEYSGETIIILIDVGHHDILRKF